jgi:radical SAM superfamily enzyme YgiQ (UPF0313 family)
MKHNSTSEFKVLDLNIEFHKLKFGDYMDYFQSSDWDDYDKVGSSYKQLTKEVYATNNAKVVNGLEPEFFSEMLQKIKDEKPDVVAFSVVYSSQAFYAYALLKKLKDVVTVVGGPAVSSKIVGLANHFFKNELECLNFIEGKKVEHSSLVFDFPLDFSIYNLQDYFTPKSVIPLKTSTTCYYQQCTFCAHYAKVPYQEYALENLERSVVKSKSEFFFLIDDMIPVKRLLELGEMFGRHGAKWACQLRPTKEFTLDVLHRLYSFGLTFVLWGVESGCQKTLDAIKKGTNVSDVAKVLTASSQVGIRNVCYIMFGFPGESESDFMETIEFVKENKIDLVSVSVFGLQKGTAVYENPLEFGISEIFEKKRTVLDSKISYQTSKGLSLEEIKKLRKKFPIANKYPKMMNFFREHMFFVN